MLITHFKAQKLHGHIDFDIEFNNDLNMLVGINGSGKTTILNTIENILKVDIAKLSIINFKSIDLCFIQDSIKGIISLSKNNKKMILNLVYGDLKPPEIIQAINTNLSNEEEAINYYSNFTLEEHEEITSNLIQGLPKPIIISLDRIITTDFEKLLLQEKNEKNEKISSKNKTPLSQAQNVITSKYIQYRKSYIKNDNELKLTLAMSALKTPNIKKSGPIKILNEHEIKSLRNRVSEYLNKSFDSPSIDSQIDDFFDSLEYIKSLTNTSPIDNDLVNNFIITKYSQVSHLADAFKKFEDNNKKSYYSLEKFINIINKFFTDSGKELFFEESSGQIFFKIINSKSNKNKIEKLSSGEKQILIILTFLAFIAQKGSLFIVDEPELSLHPKWQREFMNAFLELCPSETQLILATHSPEIVSSRKDKCIPL